MDMNEFVNNFFQNAQQVVDPMQVAQSQYRDMKDLFQPSWEDVSQKQRSVATFLELGQEVGRHVSTCSMPDCSFHHGIAEFCTPQVFLASVKFHCDRYKGVDPEAEDLFNLWLSREPGSLMHDPRYIAFRCMYDKGLLLGAVLKQSLQDPFRRME